jgi:hypothetical protein
LEQPQAIRQNREAIEPRKMRVEKDAGYKAIGKVPGFGLYRRGQRAFRSVRRSRFSLILGFELYSGHGLPPFNQYRAKLPLLFIPI